MSERKECIMCFREIDARAKKCPECKSFQVRFSNLEGNPTVIAALLLVLVGVFIYIAYEYVYRGSIKDEAFKALHVVVVEVSVSEQGNSLYAACMGFIENKTTYQFREVKFQVSFFSDDGKLIDAFSIKNKDLHIAKNGSTNFRVREIAQKAKALYKNCQVNIVDAWAF